MGRVGTAHIGSLGVADELAAGQSATVQFAPGFLTQKATGIEIKSAVPVPVGPKPGPMMRRGRCGFFCRHKSQILIGLGLVATGTAVSWMLFRSTRGVKRSPGMAGVRGRRRRRR